MYIPKQDTGQVTPPLKINWSPAACEYAGLLPLLVHPEPACMYGCDFQGVLFDVPLFEFDPAEKSI
jgi:hypothetical protein